MDYQDKISSYIENELTAEGEQEFLISLAASETLRRSFRSELTIKNILRQDDQMMTPPRDMRKQVFAAIGMGALSVPSSAPETVPIGVRGFFASKVQTFMSALALVGSMAVGYVMHGVIQPEISTSTTSHENRSSPAQITQPAQDQAITSTEVKSPAKSALHVRHHNSAASATKSTVTEQSSKPGKVDVDPVITNSTSK
jgi:negative regulator of sigma E activity